jgi:hypothetical protein
MSFSDAPEILFWKASDGVTGILPPTRPNLRSNDSCTLSTDGQKGQLEGRLLSLIEIKNLN